MAKISRWKVTATTKPKKKKDTTEEQRFRRKVERAANRWIGGCKVKQ